MKRMFNAFIALQEQMAARSRVYYVIFNTMKTYGEGMKLLVRQTRLTLQQEDHAAFEHRSLRRIVKRDLMLGFPCTVKMLISH